VNQHEHAIGDVIIEAGESIWAGAIVRGDLVEAGWLVMGVSAKPVRTMGPEDVEDILRNARDYVDLWRRDFG
jgi:carbonic anhydrase/acetyltransferase-like protein (isoleucine patch superfamily)